MRIQIFRLSIFFLFILCGFSVAQSSANASAGIKIRLIKGLNIKTEKGNLDFGEIILPAQNKMLIKSPDKGLRFTLKGQPEKSVMFTFQKAILKRIQENKRLDNVLQFKPLIVRTNEKTNFFEPTPILNGQFYKLQNQKGEGRMYIWVGGKLKLTDNPIPGDYQGTFTLSVAY